MDLRYHAGGSEVQIWNPLTDEITALMEFFPMDVEVEAGHTIRLSIRSTGEDYLPSAASSISQLLIQAQLCNLIHLTRVQENIIKPYNVLLKYA